MNHLGDVPGVGRVIKVLPLVEVGLVLDGGGVRAVLRDEVGESKATKEREKEVRKREGSDHKRFGREREQITR